MVSSRQNLLITATADYVSSYFKLKHTNFKLERWEHWPLVFHFGYIPFIYQLGWTIWNDVLTEVVLG